MWTIQIKCHSDRPDSVGWSVLIVIVVSVLARGVGGLILSKCWLKDLVDPVIRWFHAGLTTVSVLGVDGVELLKRESTAVTAVNSWLWLGGVESVLVEEERVFSRDWHWGPCLLSEDDRN